MSNKNWLETQYWTDMELVIAMYILCGVQTKGHQAGFFKSKIWVPNMCKVKCTSFCKYNLSRLIMYYEINWHFLLLHFIKFIVFYFSVLSAASHQKMLLYRCGLNVAFETQIQHETVFLDKSHENWIQ